MPPDADIGIYRNGLILRDHDKVQHGDTLWITYIRHRLNGGMKRNGIAPEKSFDGDSQVFMSNQPSALHESSFITDIMGVQEETSGTDLNQ